MKNVQKYIFTGMAGAVLAAVGIGSFYAGKNTSDTATQQLLSQIDSLRKGEKDAAVVRRVSQQMEDIAYQQKEVSDKQRERAEEQSLLAVANAKRAEDESRAARLAEEQAIRSAEEAEHQRANAETQQKIAVEQRNEATSAKNIADTLNYRSLARTLGTTSLLQREGGDTELADLLAYASWHFLNKYKGNEYVAEAFKAISQAADKSPQTIISKRGAINAISIVPQRKNQTQEQCVAVSNYGEVELITSTSKGLTNTPLLQNTDFTFSDVWAGSKDVYALSTNGTLCIVGYDGTHKTMALPADRYTKLIRTDSNTLLIAGRHTLLWYTFNSASLSSPITLKQELSTIVKRNNSIILFFTDGSQAELDKVGSIKECKPTLNNAIITAAIHDKKNDCMYLGTKKGNVFPINKFERCIENLDAHSSKVADIAIIGSVMVSGGYDKMLYVWQMKNLFFETGLNFYEELNAPSVTKNSKVQKGVPMGWIVPVEIPFDGWTLAVEACADGKSIWIGTSTGRIIRMNVTVDDMAHIVEKKLTRNMTQSEWNRFVGISIPYIKFK